MILALLFLLQVQAPAKPESILWTYRVGQDFFVEENQRQLLQVTGSITVSSYLDYSYLWHYSVKSEAAGDYKLQATLEKVRVNNPNEAGARAIEKLKLKEGSQSDWILKKATTGWTIHPAPDDYGKHALPCFLTLGTPKLDETPAGWKQSWKVPISDWGEASLQVAVTVKQQFGDMMLVSTKGQLEWTAGSDKNVQISVIPQSNPIAGLGNFDLTRGRWTFVEWRADGAWQVNRAGVTCTMKQDLYCNYRCYERRPTFP